MLCLIDALSGRWMIYSSLLKRRQLTKATYRSSSHSIMLSVCPSIWSKNRLRDENGKGNTECGSDGVVVGVGLRVSGEGKGENTNTCFWSGCAAHIHYFNDIRQRALPSNCVLQQNSKRQVCIIYRGTLCLKFYGSSSSSSC